MVFSLRVISSVFYGHCNSQMKFYNLLCICHIAMKQPEGTAKTERLNCSVFAVADTEYDTTQGEPVAEKEVGRNSVGSAAFESKPTVHKVVHEEKLIYKEKTVLE